MACRSTGTPCIGAYWLRPSRMCRVTASTSAGSQSKSGKPCDRLIAPRSAASFDMTVKIVVPTFGNLDFSILSSCASGHDLQRLERARVAVLAYAVPAEVLPVHRNVDTRRKHLDERQRASEVEQSVGTAERVRHHRAGENDGLGVERGGGERPRGLDHRVGAVRDHDRLLARLVAPRHDRSPAAL